MICDFLYEFSSLLIKTTTFNFKFENNTKIIRFFYSNTLEKIRISKAHRTYRGTTAYFTTNNDLHYNLRSQNGNFELK